MKQTRQAVRAVKQSIFLDVYASGPSHIHKTGLEIPAEDKHSSLLQKFVDHGRKKLYNTEHRCLYLKSVTIVNYTSKSKITMLEL